MTSTIASVYSKVISLSLPMTIRKKKVNDQGEVTVVDDEIKNPWVRLVLSQHGWRLVIIILLATMHPVGRSFLAGFGFEFQDTRKIAVAAEEAKASKAELTTIADSVKEIKADVSTLKANNAIINTKVDALSEKQTTLEQTFR